MTQHLELLKVAIGLFASAIAVFFLVTDIPRFCSAIYQDEIYETEGEILGICKKYSHYRYFADRDEVDEIVDGARYRNFGEQCYKDEHCRPGADGTPRCWPLDRDVSEGTPEAFREGSFCLAYFAHCPFPGTAGIFQRHSIKFGKSEYTCLPRANRVGTTVGYIVTRAGAINQ